MDRIKQTILGTLTLGGLAIIGALAAASFWQEQRQHIEAVAAEAEEAEKLETPAVAATENVKPDLEEDAAETVITELDLEEFGKPIHETSLFGVDAETISASGLQDASEQDADTNGALPGESSQTEDQREAQSSDSAETETTESIGGNAQTAKADAAPLSR